jgi:hypothetical protein
MARSFYYMAVSFLLVFLSSALMSVASSILNGPGRDVLIIFWQFPLAWVLLLPTFFVLSDFLPEFQFWKIPLAASLFFVVWALAFKGQPMSFFASLFIAVAVFPFLINWFVEPSLKIGSFNFKRETLFLVGGFNGICFAAILNLRVLSGTQVEDL